MNMRVALRKESVDRNAAVSTLLELTTTVSIRSFLLVFVFGIPTSVSNSALMVLRAVSNSFVMKFPLRSVAKYIHGA